MSQFFVISVDRASPYQLNVVHELIKQHAKGWWHHHANLWIVGSNDEDPRTKKSSFWRDLIKPAVVNSQARILVLNLPSEDARGWAVLRDKSEWLKKTYTKRRIVNVEDLEEQQS